MSARDFQWERTFTRASVLIPAGTTFGPLGSNIGSVNIILSEAFLTFHRWKLQQQLQAWLLLRTASAAVGTSLAIFVPRNSMSQLFLRRFNQRNVIAVRNHLTEGLIIPLPFFKSYDFLSNISS